MSSYPASICNLLRISNTYQEYVELLTNTPCHLLANSDRIDILYLDAIVVFAIALPLLKSGALKYLIFIILNICLSLATIRNIYPLSKSIPDLRLAYSHISSITQIFVTNTLIGINLVFTYALYIALYISQYVLCLEEEHTINSYECLGIIMLVFVLMGCVAAFIYTRYDYIFTPALECCVSALIIHVVSSSWTVNSSIGDVCDIFLGFTYVSSQGVSDYGIIILLIVILKMFIIAINANIEAWNKREEQDPQLQEYDECW